MEPLSSNNLLMQKTMYTRSPNERISLTIQDYFTLETGNEEILSHENKLEYALALIFEDTL